METVDSPDLMPKGDYARSRDKSPSYVSWLIKRGKLGPPAITPEGLIVPELADRMIRGLVKPDTPRLRSPKPAKPAEKTGENGPGSDEAPLKLSGRRGKQPPRDLSNVVPLLGPPNQDTGEILQPEGQPRALA